MSKNDIIKFRRELHRFPELSNKEFETSERITDFIKALNPDEILSLGKTGKAFVFKGKQNGKTLMFRAELDALPIQESTQAVHASVKQGIAHVCGHDGHMAILAGLAEKIASGRPDHGRVVLLFQPAEEIEQGAKDVVENPAFKTIEPDYIFALHNIPGEQKNMILLRNGTIAAASKGMTVKLKGKTSHAAEPENGISPARALSLLIIQLQELVTRKDLFEDMALLTIIHIRMGELSFGTTPGDAEMMITLRAVNNEDMMQLTGKAEKIIRDIAGREGLSCEISYSEVFPALTNDSECVKLAESAAKDNKLKIKHLDQPYKWSEDFSYFSMKYKACFFGLGAGNQQAQLHNPDFDFPDDILDTGVNIFYSIYKKINLKDA